MHYLPPLVFPINEANQAKMGLISENDLVNKTVIFLFLNNPLAKLALLSIGCLQTLFRIEFRKNRDEYL